MIHRDLNLSMVIAHFIFSHNNQGRLPASGGHAACRSQALGWSRPTLGKGFMKLVIEARALFPRQMSYRQPPLPGLGS